jgi:hypothetical protein
MTGKIEIAYNVEKDAKGKFHATITVTGDTGRGVPVEQRTHTRRPEGYDTVGEAMSWCVGWAMDRIPFPV